MRIVIVEDNEPLANAIAYRLRDRGHAADVLSDGDAADLYLEQEGADLVVLDINLPGRSGLEILKSLRNRGDGVPVILLTARTDTKDRVSGLDMGADDYLIKPFEMDELEARIRALSRRKQLDYGTRETIGKLEFDRGARQVTVDGDILDVPRPGDGGIGVPSGTPWQDRPKGSADRLCLRRWHRYRRHRRGTACLAVAQTACEPGHQDQDGPGVGIHA